jgi:hypothetical protein
MLRSVKRVFPVLMLAATAVCAHAYSLLGPLDTWQIQRISYGHDEPVFPDLGGPMNIGEEYRWNMKTVTYGIDPDFMSFYGERGAEEVRKAFAILNDLPPFSKMSDDLSEYPLNTRHENYEAGGLLILDLKSWILAVLVNHMGLTSPERYVWTLRDRVVDNNTVFYFVTMRNFDAMNPNVYSKFVNGTLYTYGIFEVAAPPYDWADAVEYPLDPLAQTFTTVASIGDGLWAGGLNVGQYVTGLTRDDVAGLRHLYRPDNYKMETLVPGAVLAGGGPLAPVDPNATNGVPVDLGLRGGADKITFVEAKYRNVVGQFVGLTNVYLDTFYNATNGLFSRQYVAYFTTNTPDILITAEDMNGTFIGRTDTAGWINNDANNGSGTRAGPGVIAPGLIITLSTTGPYFQNDDSDALFLFEPGAAQSAVWGAFDGTTNRPVIFPTWESLEDLEQRILRE